MFFPGKKSVDGVMAAFKSAISDLGEVASREHAEAERQECKAAQALSDANAARIEAARAESVMARLNNLISA